MNLPLPLPGTDAGLSFSTPDETGISSILTGLLLPVMGPITAAAPLTAVMEANGSLGPAAAGRWQGKLPGRWLRVERPGCIVAGFRVLMRKSSKTVRTQQVQIFWKSWHEGAAEGPLFESRVYGSPAAEKDETKVVEIALQKGDLPTGLYGQTDGDLLAQFSLTVKRPIVTPTTVTILSMPAAPSVPKVPEVKLKI